MLKNFLVRAGITALSAASFCISPVAFANDAKLALSVSYIASVKSSPFTLSGDTNGTIGVRDGVSTSATTLLAENNFKGNQSSAFSISFGIPLLNDRALLGVEVMRDVSRFESDNSSQIPKLEHTIYSVGLRFEGRTSNCIGSLVGLYYGASAGYAGISTDGYLLGSAPTREFDNIFGDTPTDIDHFYIRGLSVPTTVSLDKPSAFKSFYYSIRAGLEFMYSDRMQFDCGYRLYSNTQMDTQTFNVSDNSFILSRASGSYPSVNSRLATTATVKGLKNTIHCFEVGTRFIF